MSKLKGKVAVVTGASKGIGAGIAKSFGLEGASVVVNYSSSKEGAEKVVAEIEKNGGKAIAVQGDMSKIADVKRLFAETKKNFGKVDILVNNAGVFKFAALEEVTEEEFHRQTNTNVLGPILATQESLNYFPSDGGSVINISSIASEFPPPQSVVYASTKGALDTISKVLAMELSPKKIRVNTIAPGGVETEGAHSLGLIGSEFEKEIISKTPLGRLGQPDDIAKVAVFLASDDSFWLTGERIGASGGYK
ncbi:SDR family NAD(P)-dependent oxidoreductase [Leptospira sarikeiensis]|uniref:Glucose 1-dehydrogenase n=1 Tax=Leptospira sarikeiensis TaxID=2484943 RepID=A0A4V3JR42_9LEPT|nr:glucose 1-dehydrogenase [Leptospira sarikeiensis]TGL58453.1 glucose 1-dehydrogenase [Leptospira sarikeiensis]